MKTSSLNRIRKNSIAIQRGACFLAILISVILIGCKSETTMPTPTATPTATSTASSTATSSELWHWTMEDGWRQRAVDGEMILEGTGHS